MQWFQEASPSCCQGYQDLCTEGEAFRHICKLPNWLQMMNTKDVRVDQDLNKAVWSRGVRNVPYRIRVRIERRRNEDEDAKEELYSYVTFVDVPTFKGVCFLVVFCTDYVLGLQTKTIDAAVDEE